MRMPDQDQRDRPVLQRFTHIIDRSRSNRMLTRLRVLLRGNEFYLIPLALVVGVIAGAVVTLMSEIAQIAHVLIYGIPIDVRLSANAYVVPWVALTAPENLERGRPDRGQCVAWRTAVGTRQRGGELADADLERRRRFRWP